MRAGEPLRGEIGIGTRVADYLPPDTDLSVFRVTPENYIAMTLEERLGLIDAAAEVVDPFLEALFGRTNADWAILEGADPQVHSMGGWDESPTDEDKWSMIVNEDFVPFQFFKDDVLDAA